MNRYFFYHFFMVSFMNLMLYVPYILIQYRYTGAVSSILVAVVIGSTLAYTYTSALSYFPGMGLPEILRKYTPKWFVSMNLIFFAMMWFIASMIVICAYAILINRFFNPDANSIIILILLIIGCGYAASRSTLSVLLILEISLLGNVPLIFFVLFKAVRSPQLNFDAMHTVANYFSVMPNLTSIAAASSIFTGYINMSLFNRLIPRNHRQRYMWIVPVMGLIILLVTFFVPIGLHGTEGVNQYVYVWTTTADSLIMQYGFIERVVFVFLLVYLNLSLVYTMAGWHQAMEFIKGCFPKRKIDLDNEETPLINYIICSAFICVSILYLIFTNERFDFMFTYTWMVVRFFTEFFIVALIFILSRKERRSL